MRTHRVGKGASRRAHHLSASASDMVGTLRFAHPTAPAKLSHLPLIPDRAEMLVDAEHDQDEFRGDARKHHAYHDTGN
jgi:hypothetical protein